MKKIIYLFLFLTGYISFAQKKPAVKSEAFVKIHKGQLIQAKALKDLIALPKGCKVSGYFFTCSHFGSLHEITVKGGAITKELAALFKKFQHGQVFVITQIKSGCSKSLKKKYEIKLDG